MLVINDGPVDLIAITVVFDFGSSVICMAQGSRGVIHQLQLQVFCPCRNCIIVPFIGRKKPGYFFYINSMPGHGAVVIRQIKPELVFCQQQAVSFIPVTVQQVFVGMGPKVMTLFFQVADDRMKTTFPVKVTGKKEGSFYFLFLQGFMNEVTAVGKLMPGKN